MDEYKITLNNSDYTLYVGTDCDNDLIINIATASGYIEAIIEYIACGDNRFDYKIIDNKTMDKSTIETLLEEFTTMLIPRR